jgi:hypothetical protein
MLLLPLLMAIGAAAVAAAPACENLAAFADSTTAGQPSAPMAIKADCFV